MWDFLEPLARLLNARIVGSVTLGTVVALLLALFGAWLLFTAQGRSGRVFSGFFLIALAAGFFWVVAGSRPR